MIDINIHNHTCHLIPISYPNITSQHHFLVLYSCQKLNLGAYINRHEVSPIRYSM